MRRVRQSVAIHISEARLPAIRIGHPSEEVIEAAIFHGDRDNMLYPRRLRTWQGGHGLSQKFGRSADARQGRTKQSGAARQ